MAIVTPSSARENPVATMNDDRATHLADGLRLARARRYFDAHEAFELAWRSAPVDERDFFQGLVHVVVAWYQAGRGNRVGCERQLEKAARRLGAFAPVHRDVTVAEVLAQVAAARRAVADGSLELEPLHI